MAHTHSWLPDISRRSFLAGSAGAAFASTLGVVGLASPAGAAGGVDRIPKVPLPKPIEAVIPVPGVQAPFDAIRWLLPGPTDATTAFNGLPGFGLDVDPSTMSDFDGFVAYSVIEGQARGSDGKTYDVESDVRVMQGTYVAEDGSTNHGTFGFF